MHLNTDCLHKAENLNHTGSELYLERQVEPQSGQLNLMHVLHLWWVNSGKYGGSMPPSTNLKA